MIQMILLLLILEQTNILLHTCRVNSLSFPLTLDPVIRVAGQSGTGKVEAWKP